MITEKTPLTMGEALQYIDEENPEIKAFVKKFSLSEKKSKELRKKLTELDLLKLKESDVIKIVDVAPENEDEVAKICSGLNEDEIKKILDAVKEFK